MFPLTFLFAPPETQGEQQVVHAAEMGTVGTIRANDGEMSGLETYVV